MGRRKAPSQPKIRIVVDNDQVKFFRGDSHLYDDQFTKTFPWLCLSTLGQQITAWEKIRIEGDATIPRQVSLIRDQYMDGWISSSFNESQKRRRLLLEQPTSENDERYHLKQSEPNVYDWTTKDGQLTGRSDVTQDSDAQSWIYYQRPLVEQETISYEFYYQPDKIVSHPTIGRIAFLLDADGVRTRMISKNATDAMLLGLTIDNAKLEAECQRHSGNLPLLTDQWNKVELKHAGTSIQLNLNGTLVFERPIDATQVSAFGFYKLKKHEARIRNVNLSGPWPEKLDQSILADLYKVDKGIPESAETTVDMLVNDRFVSGKIEDVVKHASSIAPEQAYEELLRWVLPPKSPRIRPYYSMTGPSTVSESGMPVPVNGKPWTSIQSPAIELAKLAKQLGRTEQLRKEIELKRQNDPTTSRQADALLAITMLEANDVASAKTMMDKMPVDLKQVATDESSELDLSPEFVVAWRLENFWNASFDSGIDEAG
ncbi:MAG: DUF1583 domain-containing protein [Pirellulales bacterium]